MGPLTNQDLFILFVLAAGIIVMAFFWGRRRNLSLIRAFGKELENAIKPEDQEYTWLGGEIGFRADYVTKGPFKKVEATVALLPRQSLLYYPISKLTSGYDKLYVVFHPIKKIIREIHVIEKRYHRFRLSGLKEEPRFAKEEVRLGEKTLKVLSEDRRLSSDLVSWIRHLPNPALLKHIALVPETGTVYLLMTPRLGLVQKYVEGLMRFIEVYI